MLILGHSQLLLLDHLLFGLQLCLLTCCGSLRHYLVILATCHRHLLCIKAGLLLGLVGSVLSHQLVLKLLVFEELLCQMGLIAGPLALLHCYLARVRAQQSVWLLALLYLFVLQILSS